jgi:hypothetical protein
MNPMESAPLTTPAVRRSLDFPAEPLPASAALSGWGLFGNDLFGELFMNRI